jgi:hypothetical protein
MRTCLLSCLSDSNTCFSNYAYLRSHFSLISAALINPISAALSAVSSVKAEKMLSIVDGGAVFVMVLGGFFAVFASGMVLGGWLTWKYLLVAPLRRGRDPVVLATGTQTYAPAPEVLPAQVLVPLPIPAPVHTVISTSVAVFVTPHGSRFHTRQDCYGLRNAGSMSTKTRCLLCG